MRLDHDLAGLSLRQVLAGELCEPLEEHGFLGSEVLRLRGILGLRQIISLHHTEEPRARLVWLRSVRSLELQVELADEGVTAVISLEECLNLRGCSVNHCFRVCFCYLNLSLLIFGAGFLKYCARML